MKNKILAMLLIFTMVISFASCSNNEKAASDGDNNEKKVEEKSEEKAGNEITVWCWDPAFNIYAMQEAEKAYNAKNKDNPIKLNIVDTPWPDVQSKLTAVGTTGQFDQLPDIMLMQDNAFIKNYNFFPEVFADLSDSGIDFDGEMKRIQSDFKILLKEEVDSQNQLKEAFKVLGYEI